MFKRFFKTKEEFSNSFLEELSTASPRFLSIDLSENGLKVALELAESKKIAVDLTEKGLILTKSAANTKKVPSNSDLKQDILSQIERVILEKMEQAKKEIHLFPNISEVTDGEKKGEEWLKVTNHVLKESLKKASSDKSLALEAKLFLGAREKEGDLNFRLQCYNLDYSLTFLTNGKLCLSVFDDKNFERGHADKPSYSGEFYNNRPMILDEFIKLFYELFTLSNFKIFS